MTQPQIKFRLTGWKALPVIALAVAFLGYQHFTMKTTLAEEASELLKLRLQGEYAGIQLKDLNVADLKRSAGPSGQTDPRIQNLLDLAKIEIRSIRAKGKDPVIARVEIRVNGRDPPDGKPVRYFRLRHSLVTGWRVERETTALSYYLKLF